MARGVTPAADRKDPYVTRLNQLVRKDSKVFLLDRLLIGAIVERRGAERFGLVAHHIDDDKLQTFYHAIAKSEARHWHLFVTLARDLCPHLPVDARFCELAEAENALIAELPLRSACIKRHEQSVIEHYLANHAEPEAHALRSAQPATPNVTGRPLQDSRIWQGCLVIPAFDETLSLCIASLRR